MRSVRGFVNTAPSKIRTIEELHDQLHKNHLPQDAAESIKMAKTVLPNVTVTMAKVSTVACSLILANAMLADKSKLPAMRTWCKSKLAMDEKSLPVSISQRLTEGTPVSEHSESQSQLKREAPTGASPGDFETPKKYRRRSTK